MKKNNILEIPEDVPSSVRKLYQENYRTITHGTGRLMLFAADQKIEHLNQDFYGNGIEQEVNDPEHLFKIASKGHIGAFATHFGLIARYGKQYKKVNYIVKLNGKTNLVSTKQLDPVSTKLWSVEDVITLKKTSGLKIRGIGYTIYLGSEYEPCMLTQAAQVILQAHHYGLITILWIYPRGKAVKDEKADHVIAGAAGVAAALGTDFVKLNPPRGGVKALKIAVQAAGKTKVICSGGKKINQKKFLKIVHNQIHKGGTAGTATGRNIFSYPLKEAIAITQAISKIVLNKK